MITGISNATVRRINNYLHKKKARDIDACFVAEGVRLVLETPADQILSIYIAESFVKNADNVLRQFLHTHDARTSLVSDNIFQKLSDTGTPQGILAVVQKKERTLQEIVVTQSLPSCMTDTPGSSTPTAQQAATVPEEQACSNQTPLLLILDGLQDPGNLGTILRSAEAAGATGVILGEGTVDIYSPKVVRSTMGSIYRLPFARTTDLGTTVSLLRTHGIRTVAADMNGEVTYDAFDSTSPVAFIIGNEGNGLSDTARALTQTFVSIPMCGKTESLNAAVCASLLLFEAARKRRHSS